MRQEGATLTRWQKLSVVPIQHSIFCLFMEIGAGERLQINFIFGHAHYAKE